MAGAVVVCLDCIMDAYSIAEREGGTMDDHLDDVWRANHSLRSIRSKAAHAARYADGVQHYEGVVDVVVAGGVL